MTEACEAYRTAEKPKLAKIAREYGLRDRVKKSSRPRIARKPVNYTLEGYQEEALIQWIVRMKDFNMPVTPRLLGVWANWALARAGRPDQQVGKNWPYRFMKRLPKSLDLGPVKQKTKESKRI
jgi:hypothetical protein